MAVKTRKYYIVLLVWKVISFSLMACCNPLFLCLIAVSMGLYIDDGNIKGSIIAGAFAIISYLLAYCYAVFNKNFNLNKSGESYFESDILSTFKMCSRERFTKDCVIAFNEYMEE